MCSSKWCLKLRRARVQLRLGPEIELLVEKVHFKIIPKHV